MSMGKKALLMDDMPTYEQCKEAIGEELFYVKEGLARFRKSEQVSGMPTSAFEAQLNAKYITPIRSCPIDADSDNDGVIDCYDKEPLNGTNRTPEADNDESVEFGIAEKYGVWKAFTLSADSRLYSMPFETSPKFDITVQNNHEVEVSALIISRKKPEKYVIKEATETEEAVIGTRRRIQYWIKTKIDGRFGYLPCDVLDFDPAEYVNELNNKTNSSIEAKRNEKVLFNKWYYPIPDSVGVFRPIPLYFQKYYVNGDPKQEKNSYKCTLMATASGEYYFRKEVVNPSKFLEAITASNWTEGDDGGMSWIADMDVESSQEAIISQVKSQLELNKPVLVGANDGIWNHLVVVVSYTNDGDKRSHYVVLDSCCVTFVDLDYFFNTYPYKVTWNSVNGGYAYGIYPEND